MKKLLTIFLLTWSLASQAQYVSVRLWPDKVGPFQNPTWNNWNVSRGINNDSSQALIDMMGNQTKIRVVLTTAGTNFDNGLGYLKGQTWLPDTVLQKGLYWTKQITIMLTGLDDSSLYSLAFFSSRLRTPADSQLTKFSVGGFSQTVMTDANASRPGLFANMQSVNGKLIITIAPGKPGGYAYLNGFQLIGARKVSPIKAKIILDSTTINYPNSVVRVTDSSKGPGITSSQWFQVSGPSTAIFTPFNKYSPSAFVSGLVPGNYTIQLTVSDSLGNTDSARINVTLKAPAPCPVCAICPPPVKCPICPTCPPVIVCPAPRTASGIQVTLNGIPFNIPIAGTKITYSDGNP